MLQLCECVKLQNCCMDWRTLHRWPTLSHLFLACSVGRAGRGGACTQSLLNVQVQAVQFSHQLAHGLRPGSLEQWRLLQDEDELKSMRHDASLKCNFHIFNILYFLSFSGSALHFLFALIQVGKKHLTL